MVTLDCPASLRLKGSANDFELAANARGALKESSFISLLPRALGKHLESPDVVGMHACQVASKRPDPD
jgi:hypothetical protein